MTADEPGPAGPAPPPPGGPRASWRGWRRRRRDPLAAVLIGVLTLVLGFAIAVQVRSTDTDAALAGLRQDDLVRILDDVTAREDRLRQQIAEQRAALEQLGTEGSTSPAALEEAADRAQALGILTGRVAAEGPGLQITVRDPADRISAAILLYAVQELRGAGAETMQVDGVRIGVDSAVTGDPGALSVDGQPVDAPYDVLVIGSPRDMETAMNIPNGVVDKVTRRSGSVDVVQSDRVVVDALRVLEAPQYAEPEDED
ncbi:DUF881 domain-containing protein [Modestobacter marinus]|uniref:DUF881 domain-containing protein n=1 Tax=Modestobacter marinus TaxID=477641 RepID=UPI001C93FDC2|nr:DUF881 domain-containing protein [Modestobacter marinus]